MIWKAQRHLKQGLLNLVTQQKYLMCWLETQFYASHPKLTESAKIRPLNLSFNMPSLATGMQSTPRQLHTQDHTLTLGLLTKYNTRILQMNKPKHKDIMSRNMNILQHVTDFLNNIYTQHNNLRYTSKICKFGFTYTGTL